MKKYHIVYLGAVGGEQPIKLHREEISEADYLNLTQENVDELNANAYSLASDYFSVQGWVSIEVEDN